MAIARSYSKERMVRKFQNLSGKVSLSVFEVIQVDDSGKETIEYFTRPFRILEEGRAKGLTLLELLELPFLILKVYFFITKISNK